MAAIQFTLEKLAEMSGGEIRGDAGLTINGAASLAEAMPNEITFYGDPRYLGAFRKTRASAAFVPADFEEQIVATQIRVANPSKAFEQVVLRFAPEPIPFPTGIHGRALVADDVSLGKNISIGPNVVVEAGARLGDNVHVGANSYIGHETIIGDDTLIYQNVTIRERTKIGARVVLHCGVVLGADGFGFEPNEGGYTKVPQIGIVQIDDDVEIGANTTIDRARFGRTWIQEGVKIDNLVQIAHNVVVGKNSVICAQVGVAGSTRLGEKVILAGQVGIVGHVELSDGTIVGAQGGVTRSLAGGSWWLTPVRPLKEAKEQAAHWRRIGEFFERVKALEKKLGK